MQRTMLAAVQATDEQLIAPRYLMRISAHLAFSSSAQKDDSDWGPSPDLYGGCGNEWISFALSPFAHKKMNNSTLFITGRLQRQHRHI